MIVYNSSKNKIISDDVKVAKNFFTRTLGLIPRCSMKENEALVIKPCSSVHTFFMKFDIDVVYVDKNNKVLAVYESVKPFRILPINFKCAYVVEFCSQNISQKISLGESIELCP